MKKARGDGELNATQTNEIIKLEKEIQVEELRYERPERGKINKELLLLKNNLIQYFELVGEGD